MRSTALSVWFSALALVLALLGLEGPAHAADTCNICDKNTTPDDCFKLLFKRPLCVSVKPKAQCVKAEPTIDAPQDTDTKGAFSAVCENGQQIIKIVDERKVGALVGKTIGLTAGDVVLKGEVKALPPPTDTSPTNPKPRDKSENPPIDIDPAPPPQCTAGEQYAQYEHLFKDGEGKKGERIIYVHENLAIDARSAKFATESDRIIVRFIARRGVLCRYYAASDDKNEYKPSVGRVGGQEKLANVIANWDKKAESSEGPPSCGYKTWLPKGESSDGSRLMLEPAEDAKFKPEEDGRPYGSVDFVFGPFTSDQLTFHLFRHDRVFSGNDMQADIKIANHQRYIGWVDLMVVGSKLGAANQSISVVPENGTELTRINVTDDRAQIDIVAQVKFFAYCSGGVNGFFQPQDLSSSAVCFGLGSGLSLTHPTKRFYPIGVNVTIARYLSLNAMLLLERTTELAPGYSSGDVFSGKAEDVPTTNQIAPGLALGVGMDPTLLGDLVGQIVKAGL